MVVTKHAEQRIRERMGINKRAVRRAAQKALDEGAMHSECAGAMKKWLDKQAIAYDRKMKWRVYSGFVWAFTFDDALITIIPLGKTMLKGVPRKKEK